MKISVPTQPSSQSTLQQEKERAKARARMMHIASKGLVYLLLLAGSVIFLMPFMWMVSTSLKPSNEVFSWPPQFLPTFFVWQNYIEGWTILPFNTFLKNSLIVTIANVVGNLISCSIVAFGFARLRARGREFLFLLVLGTLMIPREVTIVPTFILFSKVGLVNTLWPLILPGMVRLPVLYLPAAPILHEHSARSR